MSGAWSWWHEAVVRRGAVRTRRVVRLGALSLALAACGEAAREPAADSSGAAVPTVGDSATTSGAVAPLPGETGTLPSAPANAAGAFRLSGNEPFWGVRIDASGLLYTTPDYNDGIRFAATAPQSTGGTLRWVALTSPPEAHTLEVTLEERACQDTMAEKTWTHTATIVFDGTTQRGCGERVTP